jgi:hypothetical protein
VCPVLDQMASYSMQHGAIEVFKDGKVRKLEDVIRARSFAEGMRQPMLLGLLIMLTRAFTP